MGWIRPTYTLGPKLFSGRLNLPIFMADQARPEYSLEAWDATEIKKKQQIIGYKVVS